MNISSEHKDYLKNKHKGGVSNQKGNNYESIYATKEIVRLFTTDADINTTLVGSQLKDAFVDDFYVSVGSNSSTYYQLKNKEYLSWGVMKPKNLKYDFVWQKYYSQQEKENFTLKLVYSNENCPIGKTSIPDELKDVTIIEYFPDYQGLEVFLQECSAVRDNLNTIMNFPEQGLSLDVMSGCLELIRSQWLELSQPNKLVSLAQIKDAYDRKHPGCPNFKTSSDVQLSLSVMEFLHTYPDFLYSIKGGNMYWKYKRMEGVIPVADLEHNLATQTPESIIELITLLN